MRTLNHYDDLQQITGGGVVGTLFNATVALSAAAIYAAIGAAVTVQGTEQMLNLLEINRSFLRTSLASLGALGGAYFGYKLAYSDDNS